MPIYSCQSKLQILLGSTKRHFVRGSDRDLWFSQINNLLSNTVFM